MEKTLLAFLFFALTFNSFSQERPPELQKKLDSLWSVWANDSQSDSTRVKAYGDYIWDGYLFTKPDSAFILAKELHTFYDSTKYMKAKSEALYFQAAASFYQNKFPESLDYYQQGLDIAQKNNDKTSMGACLNGIGRCYQVQGDYSKCIEYYERSLKMFEAVGDKRRTASLMYNIAGIYQQQGNNPKGLEYLQSSLKMFEELENEYGISTVLNGIGNIHLFQKEYDKAMMNYKRSLDIGKKNDDKLTMAYALGNMGTVQERQQAYEKALDYFKQSLELYEELDDKKEVSRLIGNIADCYAKQEKYDQALTSYQQSLAIKEAIGDKLGYAKTKADIGMVNIAQSKYTEAIANCKEGYVLSKAGGNVEFEKFACECLYDAYKATGNSKKALEFYEQAIVLKDSLYNEENTKKLTQLEMQYDFDKKEAETKAEQEKKDAIAASELKQQKLVRNGFMGGFAVVLLFAGVFLVQRNKIGKEKQRSENLLLNILPAEVAEELKQKGESEAKDFDEVSVIFTDFQSFTETADKLTAKELVNEVNTCFKAFDAITEKYGIEKIKTIGDAYMAAGGLHIPRKSEPKDVVKAALEMQAFMINHSKERLQTGSTSFKMRVGVHTGPVVAGIVGVKKFQYDIWGDTVNTASRIESNGEVGKVNISEATYNYLKDDPDFVFESRGKVQAKGKGEVAMYYVSFA